MKSEAWNGLRLPKIGLGTWSIGGDERPDPADDAGSLAALRSAISLGYVHFDTAEMYADGHTEELLGKAVRESAAGRDGLFITTKVSPEHLDYAGVMQACERSLRRLAMDYIDLYLIHWPRKGMRLDEAFRALNRLVRDGKVRHLGVSNFDVPLLKRSQQLSETPILTDQVPYSLANRSYVRNGTLKHCQRNRILLTAYTPLKEQGAWENSALDRVAQSRALSRNVLALAWLCAQPGVITIPMSRNENHQRENLAAADIKLTAADMAALA